MIKITNQINIHKLFNIKKDYLKLIHLILAQDKFTIPVCCSRKREQQTRHISNFSFLK